MRRRNFRAGAAAFATGGRTAAAQNPHLSSGGESPKVKAPAGCTDCHHYSTTRGIRPRRIEFRTPTRQQRTISSIDAAARHRPQVIVQPSGCRTVARLQRDGLNMFGAQARHCGATRISATPSSSTSTPSGAWIALQLRAPTSITRAMVAPSTQCPGPLPP